jgi:hypothetical protein
MNPSLQMSANKLIGTIDAPLGDYFLGKILGIFSKKVSKKSFKIFQNFFVPFC